MDGTCERLRLLADETRIRILHLLDQEPLTVAELQELLHLGQSSVSGHLSKLKHAQIIHAVSEGASHRYRMREDMPDALEQCWQSVKQLSVQDPEIAQDQQNLGTFRQRRGANWVDAVAGSLEHHYSPGRSWESMCQALVSFAQLGTCVDIGSGDGSLLGLLAPSSDELHCVEPSEAMGEAAQRTIKKLKLKNVTMHHASAASLPLDDNSCDSALMLQSLHYVDDPKLAIQEAQRVLKPGGRICIATLLEHQYAEAERYGHKHFGFSEKQCKQWFQAWGKLRITQLHPEDRPPHFQSLLVTAQNPK